jgi:hypothetical protein
MHVFSSKITEWTIGRRGFDSLSGVQMFSEYKAGGTNFSYMQNEQHISEKVHN